MRPIQRGIVWFSTLALSLLWALPLWAEGQGTAGAPFLNIGTSARAEGMGGAFTAVVNDVDATTWNPAGLMQLQRSTISLNHLEWFEGIRYETIGYADKYDYIGAVGVNLGYLSLGGIPKTLETVTGEYDPINSGGTFGASDLLVDIAWAGNLGGPEHKLGLGIKVISETIDDAQSFSIGVDLGDQILFSKMAWYREAASNGWAVHLVPSTLAFAIRNVGTPIKYFNQNDPLPLNAVVGLAYKFLNDDLTFALDGVYQAVEGDFVVHTGMELWIRTGSELDRGLEFALRGGYQTGYGGTSAPGFAVGAGLKLAGLGLDYVFMPFGDLGITQRISFKFSWGDVLRDKVAPKPKTTGQRLSVSDAALNDTAERMVEQKKYIEGKVVVLKSTDSKRGTTIVEAKRPDGQTKVVEPKGYTEGKGKNVTVEKYNSTGLKTNAAELIAKIAAGKEAASARSHGKYIRRTSEDAAKTASLESAQKTTAIDEVEAAAASQALNRGKSGETSMVTKTTVYFSKNSPKLNDKYLFALDKIAASYENYPSRTILVHGYGAAGEEEVNSLSVKRAEAVKDYLVQSKSIPSNKISLKGFGDKDPVAGNDTEMNRAKNRRVRVQLIKSGN